MGSKYIINGTEEVVDAFTAHSGIIVPAGQTITNNGSYAGTPIVTSITAGSGISVTNPTSPGAATVGLATSGVTAGTYQGLTVNDNGLVTAATNEDYAPLASPAFTGTPTAPTAASGTNTTQIATTAFVLENVASSGVSSVTGTDGITPTTATTGAVTLGLSAVPNTSLAGDLVSSITAGAGISVTNPSGVGAATVSATSYFASIGSASTVSTTSTTPVSTGLGILFTPTMSGNVLVMTTASISNSTSHIGTSAGIGWQAGTALVALGGAMVNNSAVVTNDNAYNIPATTIFNLSLTVGDEYAIQPIFYVAADTGTFTLANMIVLELP